MLKEKKLRIILLILLTLVLLFIFRRFSPAETVSLFERHYFWAVPLSLGLNILISLTGILPSLFLTGANTLVFGFLGGGVLSWCGEILGAGISFLLYRYFLVVPSEGSILNNRWLKPLRSITAKDGFTALLIARVLPMIPSGLINLLAALSPVPFRTFLLATALGKAPSLFLEAFIGHDLFLWRENWPRLLAFLGLTAVLYYSIRRISEKMF